MPGRYRTSYRRQRKFNRRRKVFHRTTRRRTTRTVKPHVEFKVIDTIITSNVMVSAGQFFLLNPCATGVTINTHIGQTAYMKSIDINMSIDRDGGAPTTNRDEILVALLYDKDTNNAFPAPANYQAPLGPFGMRNLNNRDRWLIMKQWRIGLTGTESKAMIKIQKYKRFSLKTLYSGSGSAVTDIRSGALFLYVITDSAAGQEPRISFRSRMRFTDA